MTLRVEREAAAAKRDEVKNELESTMSKLSKARNHLIDEEVAAKCGVKPTVRTIVIHAGFRKCACACIDRCSLLFAWSWHALPVSTVPSRPLALAVALSR